MNELRKLTFFLLLIIGKQFAFGQPSSYSMVISFDLYEEQELVNDTERIKCFWNNDEQVTESYNIETRRDYLSLTKETARTFNFILPDHIQQNLLIIKDQKDSMTVIFQFRDRLLDNHEIIDSLHFKKGDFIVFDDYIQKLDTINKRTVFVDSLFQLNLKQGKTDDHGYFILDNIDKYNNQLISRRTFSSNLDELFKLELWWKNGIKKSENYFSYASTHFSSYWTRQNWDEYEKLTFVERSNYKPELIIPKFAEEFKQYGDKFYFSGYLVKNSDAKRYYISGNGERITIENRDNLLGGVVTYSLDYESRKKFLDSLGLQIRVGYDFCSHEIFSQENNANSFIIFERKDGKPFNLYHCPELEALRKKFGENFGYVIHSGAHFMGLGTRGTLEYAENIDKKLAIELLKSKGIIYFDSVNPILENLGFFEIPNDWNLRQCNNILEELFNSNYFKTIEVGMIGLRCTTN